MPRLRLLRLLARRPVSPDHRGETRISVSQLVQIGGAVDRRIGRSDRVDRREIRASLQGLRAQRQSLPEARDRGVELPNDIVQQGRSLNWTGARS